MGSWFTLLTGTWLLSGSPSSILIFHKNSHLSEFSTIDTTELVLGALFAGNYFGGQVETLALQLRDATQWSEAIWGENLPGILAWVDPNTGDRGGDVR